MVAGRTFTNFQPHIKFFSLTLWICLYAPNSLNQYSSKENNTVRVLGVTGSTVTGAVTVGSNSSGSSTPPNVGRVDNNFGALVLTPNNPALGSISAAIGGGGNVSHTLLFPPAQQAFQYDLDGNMTNDGMWTYGYDAENRLITMTSLVLLQPSLAFTYDYLGRRVEKKVTGYGSSFDHKYIYDGNNLIAETDASGDLLRSYTWGLDIAGSLGATGGVGALLDITNYDPGTGAPTDYLTTFDGNGNIASLVRSDTGALAAVYEYGPFGEVLRAETTPVGSAVADNPFRFSTKYTDLETGLVNYGARYFSPGLGRFINRDPIEEAGGVNLYGFCGNDGVNGVDYMGNSWLSKLWDRTILKIGQQAAINWDHGGRTVVETAAAIAAGILSGGAALAAYESIQFGAALSMMATGLSVTDAIVVGAAGGFVSGALGAAMKGANFGQALEAGAIGGVIGGAIGGIGQSIADDLETMGSRSALYASAAVSDADPPFRLSAVQVIERATSGNLSHVLPATSIFAAAVGSASAEPNWNSGKETLTNNNKIYVLRKIIVSDSRIRATIWNPSLSGVGHIMLTIPGTEFVISSYFPQPHGMWGKLWNKNYNDTISSENGTPKVFDIQLRDPEAALDEALKEDTVPYWFCFPATNPSNFTNCIYGATNILNAGGANLPQFVLPAELSGYLDVIHLLNLPP